MRRAFGNRHFEVLARPHAQHVQVVTLRECDGASIPQLAQVVECLPRLLGILRECGHRHEAGDADAFGQALEESVDGIHRDSVLRWVIGDVDLDEELGKVHAAALPRSGESIDCPLRCERVDHADRPEPTRDLDDLARLHTPDEVPRRLPRREGGLLRYERIEAILGEVGCACLNEQRRIGWLEVFDRRQKHHITEGSASGEFSFVHARTHAREARTPYVQCCRGRGYRWFGCVVVRHRWHHTDMATVEIYSTMTCSSCIRAKRMLEAKGVAFEEIDVSFGRETMIERADGRHTVPQIFIDDVGIGGFDDMAALERAGKLDPMLGI